MRVLVIPVGAKPTDQAYPNRLETWAKFAAEARCDLIENLGSQWCIDNEVTGLGIISEKITLPIPSPTSGELRKARDIVVVTNYMRSQRIIALDTTKSAQVRANARKETIMARLLLEAFQALTAEDNTDSGEA